MKNENVHKMVPSNRLDVELDAFSEQGFELITAILIPSEDETWPRYYNLFFKRQVLEQKKKTSKKKLVNTNPTWKKIQDIEFKGLKLPAHGPEYDMGEWLLYGHNISILEAYILVTGHFSRILKEDDEAGLLTIDDPSYDFRELVSVGEYEEAIDLLWEAYFDSSKKDQRN